VEVPSPATWMLPNWSTAMPRPDSLPVPPMNVEKTRADPAGLISETNMSKANRVLWMALVNGKSLELVRPVI